MFIKKTTFTLILLCIYALAQNNLAASEKVKEVVRNIPYESGEKNREIINAEVALDKHPMLSSALNGVAESTSYCLLFQFDSKKRSEDEIRSTQFNGGKMKVMFTYFCYYQDKTKSDDQSQIMADVVLQIEGDFSETKQEIFDPTISYSKCYSHFCGSN